LQIAAVFILSDRLPYIKKLLKTLEKWGETLQTCVSKNSKTFKSVRVDADNVKPGLKSYCFVFNSLRLYSIYQSLLHLYFQ